MPFPRWKSLTGGFCVLGYAAIFTASLAAAQSTASTNQINAPEAPSGESSSLELAKAALPGSSAALPSAPGPASAGGQQDQTTTTYSGWDLRHRLTIEASGGANAPAGDKSYITWGGQFTLGGGFNINQYLAAMIEYQFMDDKIPGAVIAETGATGGHYHIWSFTLDPVFDLLPKASNDIYVTGGGGFYRKVTDFTDLTPEEFCTYFGYCGVEYAPSVIGHFSSNQGGWNAGGGYQHRFGGMYGESRTRFFAEVRYVEVLSPAAVGESANGLSPVTIGGDTKLLPFSLGIRW